MSYQELFLGVKAAGAVITKSGNLNFLEPFGPVQACNGTALRFTCRRKCNIETKSDLQRSVIGHVRRKTTTELATDCVLCTVCILCTDLNSL